MKRTLFPLSLAAFGLCVAVSWSTATPSAAQGRDFNSPEVQSALKALEKEPTIQECQSEALKFFRIDADNVDSMRSRAGWKSVLPSLAVGGRYNKNDIDLGTFDLINFPDQKAGQNLGDSTGYEAEVKATWDLSRLAFNPEVLDVSSLVVLQESVLKQVTRLYYTRRRLQVDLILNPPADPATKLSKELRIEELTATLDAMTGNLFARSSGKLPADEP